MRKRDLAADDAVAIIANGHGKLQLLVLISPAAALGCADIPS